MGVPVANDLCALCYDGACPFCLLGWPEVPLTCGCHGLSEVGGPPCPRCGFATVITTIDTPRKMSTRATTCLDRHCSWEHVERVGQTE